MSSSAKIKVTEVRESTVADLQAQFSSRVWKAWRKTGFNQKKFLAMCDGSCLGGLIAVEGVEPYTGLVQISLRHHFSFKRSEFARFFPLVVSAVQTAYQGRRGWLSFSTSIEEKDIWPEKYGFDAVQLDLAKSLTGGHDWRTKTQVRDAEASDLEWIKSLSTLCLPTIVCNPPGFDKELTVGHCRKRWPTMTQELELLDESVRVLVALSERGERIAYAVLDLGLDEAWIHDFAVTPEHRGGRVARDMLSACEKIASELGHRQVWATASIENRRSWVPACRVGFKEVSRRWLSPLS